MLSKKQNILNYCELQPAPQYRIYYIRLYDILILKLDFLIDN